MEAEEARFRVPEVPEEDAGGELDINAILTSSEVHPLSLSRVRALSLFTCMYCVRVFTYTYTRTQEEASTAATASYMPAVYVCLICLPDMSA